MPGTDWGGGKVCECDDCWYEDEGLREHNMDDDVTEPATEETPAPEPTPTPDALTAFLVFVTHDGTVIATSELDNEVTIERAATIADMRRACQEVVHDINISLTSEQTAQHLQAMLQAAKEPTPSQRIAARLKDRNTR